MKLALLVVLVAGCLPPAEPPPDRDDYDYDDGGWTGPGGDPFSGCRQDSECGTQVCARDGDCYPAASIRLVTTTWTVRGEPANATSCATHPDLFIHFETSNGASFGYAPVPCKNGKFTIDKLPLSYTRVELGIMGTSSGTSASITSAGDTSIDLR
jgi:hypothetical protein